MHHAACAHMAACENRLLKLFISLFVEEVNHLLKQHKLKNGARSLQPTNKNSDLILYFSFYHSRFVFILLLMC